MFIGFHEKAVVHSGAQIPITGRYRVGSFVRKVDTGQSMVERLKFALIRRWLISFEQENSASLKNEITIESEQ